MAKKEPRVREAIERDKGLFRKLWGEFQKESHEMGHWVLPTKANLDVATFFFEQYTTKQAEGIVLFIANDAVLMWGTDMSPVETVFEKPAQGWGIYIKPERRREGLSLLIRDAGKEKLSSMGFTHVVGSTPHKNEASYQSSLKVGFVEQPLRIGVLTLKDEE